MPNQASEVGGEDDMPARVTWGDATSLTDLGCDSGQIRQKRNPERPELENWKRPTEAGLFTSLRP